MFQGVNDTNTDMDANCIEAVGTESVTPLHLKSDDGRWAINQMSTTLTFCLPTHLLLG